MLKEIAKKVSEMLPSLYRQSCTVFSMTFVSTNINGAHRPDCIDLKIELLDYFRPDFSLKIIYHRNSDSQRAIAEDEKFSVEGLKNLESFIASAFLNRNAREAFEKDPDAWWGEFGYEPDDEFVSPNALTALIDLVCLCQQYEDYTSPAWEPPPWW